MIKNNHLIELNKINFNQNFQLNKIHLFYISNKFEY